MVDRTNAVRQSRYRKRHANDPEPQYSYEELEALLQIARARLEDFVVRRRDLTEVLHLDESDPTEYKRRRNSLNAMISRKNRRIRHLQQLLLEQQG